MKKTPLQQLILKLADKQDEHQFNTEYDDGVRRGLALAIVNARELLPDEKEMIVDACDHNKGVNGWSDGLELRLIRNGWMKPLQRNLPKQIK